MISRSELPVPLCALLFAGPLTAQDRPADGQRAPPRSFALPMEFEHDFGATNGDATFLRIQPLYALPLGDRWRLMNLDIVTLADSPGGVPGQPGNPNPASGERAFGLGDWIHASFLTPENQSGFIWGAGMMLSLPTATDEVLGSGRWATGPALRLTFRSGSWNLGAIAGQRWSFAGDGSRPDVNALMIRGSLRHQLPGDWYLVSAPIITVNWDASPSERWLVPVGGGVGKGFAVGSHRWAASMQAYYNAIRPDSAPDWAIRLTLVAAIPT